MTRRRQHPTGSQWKQLSAHVKTFRPETAPLFYGGQKEMQHNTRVLGQLFLRDVAHVGLRRAREVIIDKRSPSEIDSHEVRLVDTAKILGADAAERLLSRFANLTFWEIT